ncbi:hypothetical protein AB1M95_18930 [Sulfitobacter sp. LCG007]
MSASSFFGIAVLAALALASHQLHGQTAFDVHFDAGSAGTEIEGAVKGDAYVDYVLGARSGQTMDVSLVVSDSTGNGTVYFNVLPPGSDGEAIYIGSIEGSDAEIDLPADGDYRIRVYQMGNDRDTGQGSGFTLSVSIR